MKIGELGVGNWRPRRSQILCGWRRWLARSGAAKWGRCGSFRRASCSVSIVSRRIRSCLICNFGCGVRGAILAQRFPHDPTAASSFRRAPGLGLNSCKVETTYYDSLVLTAVATPAQMQQPVAPRMADGFQPMKAAAAMPAAATSPVYLAFRFRCVMRNGQIVLEPTSEPYYHEALDYRPATPFDICPPTWVSRRVRGSSSPVFAWSAKAAWRARRRSRLRARRSRCGWCVSTATRSYCPSIRAPPGVVADVDDELLVVAATEKRKPKETRTLGQPDDGDWPCA